MTDARTGVKVGAATALIGTLFSGPIGLWVVSATHPQPAWQDSRTFVASYHDVQTLPYFAGFLLIGGFVLLIAGLHAGAWSKSRSRSAAALAFASAFAAIVAVNYAIQTTFIPTLVKTSAADHASLIAALTMSNPYSLGWSLEMWGYAVLGVATWLCASCFVGGGLLRTTRALFIANGPISILSAIATALWPGWVLTRWGILAFSLWNLLIVLMTALAIPSAHRLPLPHNSTIEAGTRNSGARRSL